MITDFDLTSEPAIRLGLFLFMIVLMASWEGLGPRRARTMTRTNRWPGNIGIALINAVLVRLFLPGATVGMAVFAGDRDWGLLPVLAWPVWIAVPLSVVVLDLAIYLQHVLFHAVPVLWRLHRLHHADLDFDFTTGIRFHPIEIFLSMGIKFMVIAAWGAPALGVLIFEAVLSTTSLFNHGNVNLPASWDRALRWAVVTPDMYRVHHSIRIAETNSNFGFNLPWWDRFLGTYRAQPATGHTHMTIGIEAFRDSKESRLDRLLIQPWGGDGGDVPIHRDPVR